MRSNMTIRTLLKVVSAAFFVALASLAQAQTGTVTNHAFAIGKGPGVTGFTSMLCTSAQLAVGQAAADPICQDITGDVTITAGGVTAIGTAKVTAAMIAGMTSAQLRTILSDEVGTGAAYFVGGALGTPASGTLTNATGLPVGGIASIGANTIVANATAGSASPTAVSVPSCSGANQAINWTSGTGPGCATISGTGNVTGPGSSTNGHIATYNGTAGNAIQDQSSVTTSQNLYFGSGRPWFDVLAATQGCSAADPSGATDSTTAIQCHINYMNTTYSGGVVYFPPGLYLVSGGGLLVKSGVWLVGSGLESSTIQVATDSIVVQASISGGTCPSGGHNGGIDSLSIFGYQNAAATQAAVSVGASCLFNIYNSRVWFGVYGLNTAGTDGTVFNSFICGYSACVNSTGANWYERVKLDAVIPGTLPSVASFIQNSSASIRENHFVNTDFSCQGCTQSLWIVDGFNSSVTGIVNSVFDAPITITKARYVRFSNNEFGSATMTVGSGSTVLLSNNVAFVALTPSGAGTVKCATNSNVNITGC